MTDITKNNNKKLSEIISKMGEISYPEPYGSAYLSALEKMDLASADEVLKILSETIGDKNVVFSDSIHDFSDLFCAACKEATLLNVAEYVPQIFEKNEQFFFTASHKFLMHFPVLNKLVKNQLDKMQNIDANNAGKYSAVLLDVLSSESPRSAKRTFDKIFKTPDSQLAKKVFSKLGMLSNVFPTLKEYLFAKNEMIVGSVEYYRNLGDFMKKMPDCDYVLQKFERAVVSDLNTPASLLCAFDVLGKIALEVYPDQEERVRRIIEKGVENPKNSRGSAKTGYRFLERFDKLTSNIIWGKKIQKSDKNKFGWIPNCSVDFEKPCVLCLCGDGAKDEKAASGYAGSVYNLLYRNDMENDANVYAVAYDFGDFMKPNIARTVQMIEKKHMSRPESFRYPPTFDDKNPNYINEIFNKFILPRISKDNGKTRLSTEEAKENIRKMTIFAHCHGAYTALKLEDLTQYKMQELGYHPKEATEIQKQLLVVTQSPYCPLGVSKSTMVSFASADDDEVSHHNHFQKALQKINRMNPIKLSYFPEEKGNLILVGKMGESFDNHNFWGFEPLPRMEDDVKLFMIMEGNAVVEGVKRSCENRDIPSVQKLIAPGERMALLFKKMEENGKNVYSEITGQTRTAFRLFKTTGQAPDSEVGIYHNKFAKTK